MKMGEKKGEKRYRTERERLRYIMKSEKDRVRKNE